MEVNKDKILLGKRIKNIRLNRNETLENFAQQIQKSTDGKIKTTKSNVSKWEKGLNVPNNMTLLTIAKLGNVSLEYLLEGLQDLTGNEMSIPEFSYYDYQILKHAFQFDDNNEDTPRFCVSLVKLTGNQKSYPTVVRSTLFIENNKLNAIYFENYDYDINYFPIEVTNIFESSKLVHLDSFIFEKKLVDKSFSDTFFLALFKDVSRFLEKYHQCSINDDVKVYYRKQRQNGKTKINIK